MTKTPVRESPRSLTGSMTLSTWRLPNRRPARARGRDGVTKFQFHSSDRLPIDRSYILRQIEFLRRPAPGVAERSSGGAEAANAPRGCTLYSTRQPDSNRDPEIPAISRYYVSTPTYLPSVLSLAGSPRLLLAKQLRSRAQPCHRVKNELSIKICIDLR